MLFGKGGYYAIHKGTKQIAKFDRNGKGWDLTLQLEAPGKANRVRQEWMAQNKSKIDASFKPEISLAQLLDVNEGGQEIASEAESLFTVAAPPR